MDDKARVIKKISELGFEVGYKNHSEIGWVLREYNALIKEAMNLGIKSPETYYYEGKIKGKASREGGEVGYKISEEGKIVLSDIPAKDKDDVSKTKEKTQSYYLLKKPGISSLPGLVDIIHMTELPKFLGGFKFFNRK
jgi:hypothetical protein